MHKTACRYNNRFFLKQRAVARWHGHGNMDENTDHRDDVYTYEEHAITDDARLQTAVRSGKNILLNMFSGAPRNLL